MNEIFKGTGVALITPFHKYGTIDFVTLERLIEFEIKNQVEFIVALGTTSEYPSLSEDEQMAVLDFIIRKVDKRIPVVAGIGGNNTNHVVSKINNMNFDGLDAILSVTPYYNKPQPKGQYLHFKSVATASPVPVILYNVPGRTGTNMSADTILRLASDFENIIGVKEASGDMNQVMSIIKNRSDDFLVLSGEDALTLPMIAAGADGVISVVANAYPFEYSEMVRLGLIGNISDARNYHYLLFDLIEAIFADGNPSGIKAAMEILSKCRNTLRLPLAKVNKAVNIQIKKAVEKIENEKN
ncbi:MAG: 4-hydroxy-tetrahydrodipicolinate synthase [Bacteroidales bacterium]|nr:4-hydroxy-tetrahydrodipicolinate synthase [Bacteroidales bacterium]